MKRVIIVLGLVAASLMPTTAYADEPHDDGSVFSPEFDLKESPVTVVICTVRDACKF